MISAAIKHRHSRKSWKSEMHPSQTHFCIPPRRMQIGIYTFSNLSCDSMDYIVVPLVAVRCEICIIYTASSDSSTKGNILMLRLGMVSHLMQCTDLCTPISRTYIATLLLLEFQRGLSPHSTIYSTRKLLSGIMTTSKM